MWPAQLWQGGICVADCYPYGLFDLLPVMFGVVLALLTRRWLYVPLAAAIGVLLFAGIELGWRTLIADEPPFAYWGALAGHPDAAATIYGGLYIEILSAVVLIFAIKKSLIWILFGQAPFAPRALAFLALLSALVVGTFAYVFVMQPDHLPRRLAERAHEFAGDAPARCKLEDATPVVWLPLFRGYQQPERAPNVIVGMPDAYAAFPPVYSTWMSYEHMLTHVETIHVPDLTRYEPLTAIAVEVAVSETGQVLAVNPISGPRDLYPRAIDIASRWKFLPFMRDGKFVSARLVRLSVPIGGPEQWQSHEETPRFHDWESVDITLDNDRYEDRFRVEIRGDGSVTFNGEGDWIALKGRHCAVIPRESIKMLVDEIRRADFFAMKDAYQSDRRYILSVALDDNRKQVGVFPTSPIDEKHEIPEGFWRLVDAILGAIQADRFVSGDAYSARTLLAEHWDFGRQDEANLWLLAGVAHGGNVQAVRDLLALNAPAVSALREVTGEFNITRKRHTALEIAAERGAFDVVHLLLDAPIQWSADALGGAYVGAVEQGNAEMARELVARGANVNATGAYEEMTELMAASSTGVPEAVRAALARGADVNAATGEIVALHWAAGIDYQKIIDSRANRGQVIEMLINAGAKVDPVSGNGTPLVSNWMGFDDVTAALIKHGANVNAQNYDGETALMTNKNIKAVRRLLTAGADPYLRNHRGKNALDVARADPFAQDIVPVLEQWMAAHPPKNASH